jgi:hypothetical protein
MRIKHNKKRKTAFVFEALIREATVAIIKKDIDRKNKAFSIIKKHFILNSHLKQDLDCYRSLYEGKKTTEKVALRILEEAKTQKRMIDPNGLFKQQTALIHDVNKDLGPETFNNFVPNYRSLATIEQILSTKTTPKNRIMLEGEILKDMVILHENATVMPTIDNLTYREFVKKFNNKYEETLLNEQKNLLTHYVTSFADNSLQLKMFLNEEIQRLKKKLEESKEHPEIKKDEDMLIKNQEIIDKLESFKKKNICEEVLLTVLKTQSLVEAIDNANND